MRARVEFTLDVASVNEPFARAVARLIEAAHAFNRWEPGADTFDALCDAAEDYVHERKLVIVRVREE